MKLSRNLSTGSLLWDHNGELRMKTRRMSEALGQSTWVVVMETGDEAMTCLNRLARDRRLDSASFTAIGAFQRATLAYFDWAAGSTCRYR